VNDNVQRQFVSGEVETVAEGFEFTEGPVWFPPEGLIFSDINADTIYRADKSAFRKPSGKSNGLTTDAQGRLIACEHWNRRVTRTDADGRVVVIADSFRGKKLNSPNDVIVRSDGTVFFTDPPYGLEGRGSDLGFSGVYAVSPASEITLLLDDFVKPNGLALSPDERTLYIADTAEFHVRTFDLAADGSVSNGRVYFEVKHPDGIKVDVEGNVWCAAGDGIRVYDTLGNLAATVAFPQMPANCAFGDPDMKTLYVTARTAVYKVRSTVSGIHPTT
jgi:gluconolactonase